MSAITNPTKLFYNELPFEMKITGTVNGRQEFTIEGSGLGSSETGVLKGKWVCTSGDCPIAWPALGGTLGYGFKVFTQQPNGITHWYQHCMPEGYTQERTYEFENDGVITAYHEVSYHKGVILNNVTLKAEGFKADSPVLTNGLKVMLNTTERLVPFEDGLRTASIHYFPLKGTDNEYLLCKLTTIHKPLGAQGVAIPPAQPYFTYVQMKQLVETDESRDHIVQHEVLRGSHNMPESGNGNSSSARIAEREVSHPTQLFLNELPIEMSITGSVNGQKFTIEGKGKGNSAKGLITGKWVVTSGKMPLAWPAMAATLEYGYECFANYPNGINHYLQNCMPEGYIQERTTKYENDGTAKVHHEVTYHEGVVRNVVKFEGEGFNLKGPLCNNGIKTMINSTERVIPHGKGLKSVSVQFFPLKDGSGHVLADQTTFHRSLGGKDAPLPPPHFKRATQTQMVDPEEDSNHIIQHEVIQAHDFVL